MSQQQKKDLLLSSCTDSAITMGIPLQKPPVFPLLLLLQNIHKLELLYYIHLHTLAHRQTNRHTHTQQGTRNMDEERGRGQGDA